MKEPMKPTRPECITKYFHVFQIALYVPVIVRVSGIIIGLSSLVTYSSKSLSICRRETLKQPL